MANKNNPFNNVCADGGFTCIFRTIGCIGDSLSSGEHEAMDENGKKTYHDYYEYSWGQFLARKCGSTAINMSVGGMNCKDFQQMASFNRYFSLDKNKCQAYIIALGVNDLNNISAIYPDGFGDINDVDFTNHENNKMSFVGQYVRIIQRVKECQKKARVFLMTIPVSYNETEEKKALRDKHAELLRSLCDYFEYTYVIDFRKYAPVFDEQFQNMYFLGGHMSAMGYKYMADMIGNYIDYIIKNNVDDFKQVGFIGKGVHNCSHKW